jgi:hypothetical protein
LLPTVSATAKGCSELHPENKRKGVANMKLLLDDHIEELLKSSTANRLLRDNDRPEEDFKPVVKLFCPWGGATWLLTELDPDDADTAFGLCDLGTGFAELGNVSIAEILSIAGLGGLRVERDIHFTANKSLSAYAEEARLHQRIVA